MLGQRSYNGFHEVGLAPGAKSGLDCRGGGDQPGLNPFDVARLRAHLYNAHGRIFRISSEKRLQARRIDLPLPRGMFHRPSCEWNAEEKTLLNKPVVPSLCHPRMKRGEAYATGLSKRRTKHLPGDRGACGGRAESHATHCTGTCT